MTSHPTCKRVSSSNYVKIVFILIGQMRWGDNVAELLERDNIRPQRGVKLTTIMIKLFKKLDCLVLFLNLTF